MPKMSRWIVARKMVAVFPQEVLKELVELGANLGGGWCQVHQHLHVNPENREKVIALLEAHGYRVDDVSPDHEVSGVPNHTQVRKSRGRDRRTGLR